MTTPEQACIRYADRRIVCHFSCGAASAVATKLILAEFPAAQVQVVNAYIKEEHKDNRRFLSDCETWFNHPVTVLRDEKYGASVHEVWRKKRFMANGMWGAPCSKALKRDLLDQWRLPGDVDVFGYTTDEQDRYDRYLDAHNGSSVIVPLIEHNLSHYDCLAIVERAGLILPEMYRRGYHNANCIGCCKGGEGYWNKIRRDFPDVFEECCQIQDIIGPGAYLFRNRKTGQRYSLRDLPPNKGRFKDEPPISCSFFCLAAEVAVGKRLAEEGTAREKVKETENGE